MEKAKYNLVFNRRGLLNTEGKALIQVEVYLNKKKKYFSTKIYVKPDQWDNQRKCIKNHPNQKKLNQYLTNYIIELEQTELKIIDSELPFSLELLKERNNGNRASFLYFMEEEIKQSHLREYKEKSFIYLTTIEFI